MALNNKVTAQEYDQTLRDAVNAYYEHAMNDPSMSKEEAISSTAQMAEEYLNASEEFQANLEAEEALNAGDMVNESGNESIDGGNGGIDNDDGGIE